MLRVRYDGPASTADMSGFLGKEPSDRFIFRPGQVNEIPNEDGKKLLETVWRWRGVPHQFVDVTPADPPKPRPAAPAEGEPDDHV